MGNGTMDADHGQHRVDDERGEGGEGGAEGAAATPARGGKAGRRWVRWNRRMKTVFLDHLAATCNVCEAARAIGVDPASVYYLRRSDPGFAAAWSEALELGYEMLETQVVGHALAGGGRAIENGATVLPGSDRPVGPIDIDLALRMLTHHAANRRPRRYGAPPQVAAPDDTDEVILRKLKQVSERLAARALTAEARTVDQPRLADARPEAAEGDA